MKGPKLHSRITMWWARLFGVGSLLFLFLSAFSKGVEDGYVFFLLGFVNFYILSVQHGSIPFPRNRGGIFKLGADLSFFLMLFGLLFLSVRAYKVGFLLFLLFQFLPLVHHRFKSLRHTYDTPAALFMLAGALWGLFSTLLSGWKPFVHGIFLGFQMNTFLGCMFFMLPRFSMKVKERVDIPFSVGVFLFVQAAVVLNLLGFHFNYTLLRLAALLLAVSLLAFWIQMGRFFFNYPISLGIPLFLLGLFFASQLQRENHIPLMLLGMGSFALGMGRKWFMLNFGKGDSRHDWLYHISYAFFVSSLLSWKLLLFSAVFFTLWFVLNARENPYLLPEIRDSLLNWWKF